MPYSKQTWHNAPDTTTPLSETRLQHIEDGIETAQATVDDLAASLPGDYVPQPAVAADGVLTRTGGVLTWAAGGGGAAVLASVAKAANYTTAGNEIVRMDATSAARAVTLPTAPADGVRVTVKKTDASANAVAVTCGGSDVFNVAGGAKSVSLALKNQAVTIQYDHTGGIWTVVGDDVPLSGLDLRYTPANSSALVANLPSPAYFAHRCGPVMAPEESLTAARNAIAVGCDGMHVNVNLLADGSLAIMHDTTIDRTTTGSGNVSDQTALSWQSLAIDSAGLVPGTLLSWPSEAPPTLERFLREFGGKTTLILEMQGSTTIHTAVDALITSLGIDKRTIILSDFTHGPVIAAAALGYATMAVGATVADFADLATLQAAGVKFICISEDQLTDGSFIASVHAAGMKITPYGDVLTYAYRRDQLLALGVDGFFTDGPAFLRNRSKIARTTDGFAAGVYLPGHHGNKGTRGRFLAPNIYGWADASSTDYDCIGYLQPPDPTNFTLTFDMRISANASGVATNGGFVAIGTGDCFTSGDRVNDFDGYRFQGQAQNNIVVQRFHTNAFEASIGSFDPSAGGTFALNTWFTYKIIVTPTTITFQRGGSGHTAYADATYRFGSKLYVNIGRGACGVDFRNFVLT